MRTFAIVLVFGFAVSAAPSAAPAKPAVDTRCIVASGGAAARCVRDYARAVGACRSDGDTACEAALRAPGGKLVTLVTATEQPVRDRCTAEAADRLTWTYGLEDLVSRTAEACRKWGDDFVDTAFADDPASISPDARKCQRLVAAQLARVRDTVMQAYGRRCFVAEFAGRTCNRVARDRRAADVRARARRLIALRCGAAFDTLGLVPSASGAMLDDRVDALVGIVATRSRQLALRTYPPLGLGPTAFFGSSPVGVRTLDLVDPSRPNLTGTGPRPVRVEVYYPSTATGVAGVPRDVLHLFGVDVPTIAYRDVPRAEGVFPLVLYSHGSNGARVENVTLAGHLASHGFVVVAPDHHGNNYFDPEPRPSGDDFAANLLFLMDRPLDLSFLIDRFLAFGSEPGNFFEGAVDATRVGAAGHSLGGSTVMALARGPFEALGQQRTFTDPRVKAILPLDPGPHYFQPFPTVFSSIPVPTLLLTGTQSPLSFLLIPAFGALTSGPLAMGLGNLTDAGHRTFVDDCEAPEALIGFAAECEPGHIPWRYALHVVNYLALNLFDGVLNANAEALARLDPAVLGTIEDLAYQSK